MICPKCKQNGAKESSYYPSIIVHRCNGKTLEEVGIIDKPSESENKTNHFLDDNGNSIKFDLLDPNLPAWNYSISGKTGSGMSVLIKIKN